MYGVYNPGIAHVSRDAADVDLGKTCPPNYVRVHWESSTRQSYQDFFVTRDDKPSVKARFRWYKPYNRMPYATVFSNPDHLLYDKSYFLPRVLCWNHQKYVDDLIQDVLVYVDGRFIQYNI